LGRFFYPSRGEKRRALFSSKGSIAVTVAAPILLKALPGITGIPASTVNSVYRTQREDGLIPKCQGKNIAELDSSHAVLLLLGCIADVPAHNAAKAAKIYDGLRDSERYCAGDVIAQMLDSFNPTKNDDLQFAAFAYRAYVVVDLESPRITVGRECTDGTFEQVFGVKEPKSFETRVSTSERISGKVLFELSALLNKDYWDARKRDAA
jgi:hypothetical protein